MKSTEVFTACHMLALWLATSSYAKTHDEFRMLTRATAFVAIVFFILDATK